MSPPSKDEKLLSARLAVSDAMGLAFEGFGVPRAAGRIIGWLTVCDPREQSAAEIARALHLAPSTVSTMSRMLIQWGFAERTTRPRDRKRYLRSPSGGWLATMYHEVDAWKSVKPSLSVLRELLADAPASSREGVDEFHAFIGFVERELPALFERFQAEQEKARREREKA